MVRAIEKNAAMMMSRIKATGTVYSSGSMYYGYGNNCQTAHPTRAPNLLQRAQVPVQHSSSPCNINDDESTVLGTWVRVQQRQYFGHEFYPGGRKKMLQ